MDAVWLFSEKCNEIWRRIMGMGRKKKTKENKDGLYKMDTWFRFLYSKIFDNEGIRYREIKNRLRDKSQEI